jgi:ABC-type transport system involved in cytochrome c biogenesis ATPase subunit
MNALSYGSGPLIWFGCADAGPGRLIRLEGRNGSGKSTLLRVVAAVCLAAVTWTVSALVVARRDSRSAGA